ncbi:MAG: P-loop NTPase fold protein [Hyphomicrobiaceae bacterium]
MFLSDQETEVDLLYYEAIARTVIKLIRETPESAVTIGVHRHWGAGKSSVLKMTSAAFKGNDRVVCLWFNGWTFEGFEDAKTVVIETIVDELRRARPASAKVAEAAHKVLKRIDWLKIAKKAGAMHSPPLLEFRRSISCRALSMSPRTSSPSRKSRSPRRTSNQSPARSATI